MTALAQRSDMRTGVLTVLGGLLVAFVPSAWARAQRIDPIATYATGIAVEQPEQAVLTVQEMVQAMRDGGMPVSAIAEMAGVERKTVYTWLEGTLAKTDRAQRVVELYSVLFAAGVPMEGLWRVWGRTLSTGVSLRDLLKSRMLDREAILAGCSELQPIVERQAARANVRGGPAAGFRNPITDGIPVADLG